jgi:hypothetical protein
MAGGKTSKTARASVAAGQRGAGGGVTVLGEMKFLIPLNLGKHVYVRNISTGRTEHCATDSDKLVEQLRTLATAGHAAKLRDEVKLLQQAHPDHGWDKVEAKLVSEGVFAE